MRRRREPSSDGSGTPSRALSARRTAQAGGGADRGRRHKTESVSYTDEQLAAIAHSGGHSLTYAVPGSGKTYMQVGRLGFLLSQGVEPRRIRTLAFNTAVAEEFRERMGRALPRGAELPDVQTFNALGERLTKLFEKEGLLPHRRLDTGEALSKKLVREAARSALHELDKERYPSQDDLDEVGRFIGLVKTDILSAREAFEGFDFPAEKRWFVRAYDLYEGARITAGVRFFSDQVVAPVLLMRENVHARRMVENRLDFVLVDEFQDVNRVQVELLLLLLGTRGRLNAVGDDDQSIYAWRGSRPEFMGEAFDGFFPEATRYTLSRTFRFGHRLSLAAAQLIDHNRERMGTLCVSAPSTPDTDIDVIRTTAAGDQTGVLETIEDWLRAGRHLREVGILARLWAQTLSLELALLERHIPYYKPKDSVFDVPEIIGLLGWLRLAAGALQEAPDIHTIVRHMLSTPTLWLSAAQLNGAVNAIAADPDAAPDHLRDLAQKARKSSQAERLYVRAHTWAEVRQWTTWCAADVLRVYATRTDLLDVFYRSATTDGASEKEIAYETLLDWATRSAASPAEFIDRMDRLRDARERYEAGGEALKLTTIHQAKGLQWPLVVVLGLEEGQFPNRRSAPEEERRLAYVAMTRAKESLRLVLPPDDTFDAAWTGRNRRSFGLARTAASRFAFEANLLTAVRVGGMISKRLEGDAPETPLPDVPDTAVPLLNRYLAEVGIADRYHQAAAVPTRQSPSLSLNDRVRHPAFGEGYVIGFAGPDVVDIDFGGTRRKIKISSVPLERVA